MTIFACYFINEILFLSFKQKSGSTMLSYMCS